MTIIGVDLGAKGGWVALDSGGNVIDHTKGSGIMSCHNATIYVEKPLKNRKGTQVRALTAMHDAYGYFRGQMDARHIEYIPVEYHEWARVMLGGGKYPAAMRCRELWPDNPEIAGHEGLADASLIAEYGRRLLIQNSDGSAPAR